MRNFVCGLILGLTLAGAMGYAGTFYDSKGQPSAPRGSVEQMDYFRQRQQWLDIQHMREQGDRDRLDKQLRPCEK